jgi:hypothetical protein
MNSPRNITVKARFTADHFVPFRDKCEALRIPQSEILYDLAVAWSEPPPASAQVLDIQAPATWQGIDKAKSIRPIVVFHRGKVAPLRARTPSPQQPRGANPHRPNLF